MHRQRIFAQISLILSILNLVLAAPIVVREIHEARNDVVTAEDHEEAMPNELEASPISSRPSQDGTASPPLSPLSDGSRVSLSSYSPEVSKELSDSDYLFLLDRPARESLHDPLPQPQPSYTQSGVPEISPPPGPPLPDEIHPAGTAETAERFMPLHQDVPPPSETETPVTHPKFLTKSMIKKVVIVAWPVSIIGYIIGSAVNSLKIKKHRDYQDR
jgi:hypothetical protein